MFIEPHHRPPAPEPLTAGEAAIADAYERCLKTWHTVTITEDDGTRVPYDVNGIPCKWGCEFGWHNYCLNDCAQSPACRAPYDPANFPCNGVHGDEHPHPCRCECTWCQAITISHRRDRYWSWQRQQEQQAARDAWLDAVPGRREREAAIERAISEAYARGESWWLPCDCPACTEPPPDLPPIEHEDELTAAYVARREREARCEQRRRMNPDFGPLPLIYDAMLADFTHHMAEEERQRQHRQEWADKVAAWNARPWRNRDRDIALAYLWARAVEGAGNDQ